MTYLYPSSWKEESKKQKTIYLFVSATILLLLLISILLVYYLHPRNQFWLYYAISLVLFILGVLGIYYFFFYKFMFLKTRESFLKRITQAKEKRAFIFKEEGKSVYSNKLSFSSYIFLDEEGKETTFLILNEQENPFMEGKKYTLLFSRDYLYGFEEVKDEK